MTQTKEVKIIYRQEEGFSSVLFSQILRHNGEFSELLLPHLKAEFFDDLPTRVMFQIFSDPGPVPTLEQAQAALQQAGERLLRLYAEPGPEEDFHWLKTKVEELVREQAFRQAMAKASLAHERNEDPRPHLDTAKDALHFTITDTALWGDRMDAKLYYKMVQDIVESFLDDCCEKTNDPENMIRIRDLYAEFEGWCQRQDKEVPISKRNFNITMENLGFVRERQCDRKGKHWLGLKFKPDVAFVNDCDCQEGSQGDAIEDKLWRFFNGLPAQ